MFQICLEYLRICFRHDYANAHSPESEVDPKRKSERLRLGPLPLNLPVINPILRYIRYILKLTPPPRMPVTTRIITFLVGDPNLNLHLLLASWVDLVGSGAMSHKAERGPSGWSVACGRTLPPLRLVAKNGGAGH